MSAKTIPFGNWLQAELNRRGWSQADLVRATNKSRGLVSSWVNGAKVPDSDSCQIIAAALHIDSDIVLAQAERRPLRLPLSQHMLADELQRQRRSNEATLRRIEQEVEGIRGVPVPYEGRIPASVTSYRDVTGLELDVRVVDDDLTGAHAAYALLLTEPAFTMLAGDAVILDVPDGRRPQHRQIVAVLVDGQCVLRRWCVVGDAIELQDDAEHVARRLTVMDDYEVIGLYLTFRPLAAR